jgi:hypothetical protein
MCNTSTYVVYVNYESTSATLLTDLKQRLASVLKLYLNHGKLFHKRRKWNYGCVPLTPTLSCLPPPRPRGATTPLGPGPPHYRGFTITLRNTTLGRTPLDEWSALQHNTRKTEIHAPGEIRIRKASKRAVTDPHFRPRGHRDRLPCFATETYNVVITIVKTTGEEPRGAGCRESGQLEGDEEGWFMKSLSVVPLE